MNPFQYQNVFTVTFDQFNASLLNKSIFIFVNFFNFHLKKSYITAPNIVCVCVFVCVYVCVYTYTHTHIYIYIYMYLFIYAQL